MHLYEALAERVSRWRSEHYPSENYPAIAEILEWATSPDVIAFRLRAPQLRALETYWYLRLVQETPHILGTLNQHPIDGENGAKAIATQHWVGLNPDRLKYQMIFVDRDEVGYEQIAPTRGFLNESE